jgi:hypothetical protein
MTARPSKVGFCRYDAVGDDQDWAHQWGDQHRPDDGHGAVRHQAEAGDGAGKG